MSEEKKIIELKEDDLEKVTGGCNDFDWRPGYYLNPEPVDGLCIESSLMVLNTKVCSNCTHYIRPEGPCDLGHVCGNTYGQS